MVIAATLTAIAIIALLAVAWVIADHVERTRTYVYKGNNYLLVDRCLIKDPTSRRWVSGVMYRSYKTGELFVREENDFLVKFETYKQWKKNGRNDRSSRRMSGDCTNIKYKCLQGDCQEND